MLFQDPCIFMCCQEFKILEKENSHSVDNLLILYFQ